MQGPSAQDDHTPLSPSTVMSVRLVEEMKQRVTQQPETSLQKVYNDVVQQAVQEDREAADELASTIPTYNARGMALHRARKKNEPALPKRRAEIQLPEELQTLPDGRNFLQASDGDDDKILLFAADHALVDPYMCSTNGTR